MSIEVFLLDSSRCRLGLASTFQLSGQALPTNSGVFECNFVLDPVPLASGNYSLDVTTSVVNSGWDHFVEMAAQFDVPFSNPKGHVWDFRQSFGLGSIALVGSEAVEFKPLAAGPLEKV